MKKLSAFMLPFFLLFFACATSPTSSPPSFLEMSYKTLATAGYGYNAVMTSFGDLYDRGELNMAHIETISLIGDKFWAAYHTAKMALVTYAEVNNPENKQKVVAALESLQGYQGELAQYLSILLEEGE